jgi:hypothetical protein
VAAQHVRSVLRTVRGRFVLFFTGPLVVLLGLILRHLESGAVWRTYGGERGTLLLAGAVFVALTSTLPATANSFGIDRGGLSRQLLAPLEERDLLLARLCGGGALFLGTLALCLAGTSFLLLDRPSPPAGGWLLFLLTGCAGGGAAYLTLAPLFALVSVTLPRASDLNRLGKGGNPHQGASFAAIVATTIVGSAFSVVLVLAHDFLGEPLLALIACLVWGALALGVTLRFVPTLSLALASRRDNLAQIAEAR